MGQLTLGFAGICSHFLRSPQVPALPVRHRAVLPYVAGFRFGLVNVALPEFPDPQPYYLQPHFTFLKYDENPGVPAPPAPTIPGIMDKGFIYTGCTISVVNATNAYEPNFDLYRLTDFYKDYAYSEEVVTGGRAACYFDIDRGTVTSTPKTSDAAQLASVDFITDSDPVLRFIPFGQNDVFHLPLQGETVQMTLYNAEVGPLAQSGIEDTPFDFMLHYETAKRAVPPRLTQPAPGMNRDSIRSFKWTKDSITKALMNLAEVASGANISGGPDFDAMLRLRPTSLNPSCSNSQYP
jgi:hypothetical protein